MDKLWQNSIDNARKNDLKSTTLQSLILGTLRNHDDDGNGNVKKNNRFHEQNDNSARASHFFVHFFAFTTQLRREMPKF